MAIIEKERVERVARIYATNGEASRALGIVQRSFFRLCQRYRIETPAARQRRRRAEARGQEK